MTAGKIEVTPGVLAVGAAAAALLYVIATKKAGQSVAGAAGAAAVGAVADAGAGVVTGIGEIVGIPQTDQTQCQIDLANGDYLAASFSCPAGDFIKGVFSGGTSAPNTGGATGSW